MRKFILNTLIFSLIAIALLAIYHYILIRNQKNIMIIPQNCTSIYLGNSTVECAINDSILNTAFNFAHSGEDIDKVYIKLQLLKEYNPQIDTVFIGFDDIILFKDKFSPEVQHLYFPAKYTTEDWLINLRTMSLENNSEGVSHVYHISKTLPLLKSYFHEVKLKDLEMGGYLRLYRDKLNDDIERIKKMRNENRDKKDSKVLSIHTFPEISKYYLDQIVKYCKDNNIKLYFLCTPKYDSNFYGHTLYRDIHKLYYPQVPLIDCMDMVFPDSCYGDCTHLNYRGADEFSKMLLNNTIIY